MRVAASNSISCRAICEGWRISECALLWPVDRRRKRRLADEYDAAQERGEVSSGRPKSLPDGNTSATVADVGLSSKDIHEARQIRDAEAADPTIRSASAKTASHNPRARSRPPHLRPYYGQLFCAAEFSQFRHTHSEQLFT